jgi:hypothetical protein
MQQPLITDGAPHAHQMNRSITEEEIAKMQTWNNAQVTQWLHTHNMGRCSEAFTAHEITGDLLPLLYEDDLIQMGIVTVGVRKHLLKELAKVKKAHRAFSRHKVIWRGREDLSRGNCCINARNKACPLCVDQPASYRLTGVLLKITNINRGFCCGAFTPGSSHHHNNISLKEIVDVDTEQVHGCCGTERRVLVSAQEGLNEGATSEFNLYVDGRNGNTLSGVAQMIQSAVEDAKEAVLVAGNQA